MTDKPIVCTVEDPWIPSKGVPVMHVDIEEVCQAEGRPGGDTVTYKCLACGRVFIQELPQ